MNPGQDGFVLGGPFFATDLLTAPYPRPLRARVDAATAAAPSDGTACAYHRPGDPDVTGAERDRRHALRCHIDKAHGALMFWGGRTMGDTDPAAQWCVTWQWSQLAWNRLRDMPINLDNGGGRLADKSVPSEGDRPAGPARCGSDQGVGAGTHHASTRSKFAEVALLTAAGSLARETSDLGGVLTSVNVEQTPNRSIKT